MSTNKRWSDEETEKLRKLWDGGLSCTQIGLLIGREKNAVIGKAHRLDLPMRGINEGFLRKPKIMTPGTHAPKGRNGKAGGLAMAARKARKGPTLVFDAAQAELPLPPSCKPVTFAEIGPRQCRYVIGEPNGPDTKMCGAKVEAHSLCGWHRRLCWHQKPKKTKVNGVFVMPRVGIAA